MIPQLQEFSAGYSMIELATFPQDTDWPRINADLYDSLKSDTDPQAKEDAPPVLFRHQPRDSHFRVKPDKAVPLDHIEVPRRMIGGMNPNTVPDIISYLVAKPRHAVRLARLDTIGATDID